MNSLPFYLSKLVHSDPSPLDNLNYFSPLNHALTSTGPLPFLPSFPLQSISNYLPVKILFRENVCVSSSSCTLHYLMNLSSLLHSGTSKLTSSGLSCLSFEYANLRSTSLKVGCVGWEFAASYNLGVYVWIEGFGGIKIRRDY